MNKKVMKRDRRDDRGASRTQAKQEADRRRVACACARCSTGERERERNSRGIDGRTYVYLYRRSIAPVQRNQSSARRASFCPAPRALGDIAEDVSARGQVDYSARMRLLSVSISPVPFPH